MPLMVPAAHCDGVAVQVCDIAADGDGVAVKWIDQRSLKHMYNTTMGRKVATLG